MTERLARFLARRRELWAWEWTYWARTANLLDGLSGGRSAERFALRARRRLRFWDVLVDAATLRERRPVASESDQ